MGYDIMDIIGYYWTLLDIIEYYGNHQFSSIQFSSVLNSR